MARSPQYPVTTLHTLLAQADGLYEEGRIPAARSALEELLERAQARADNGMVVTARSMLARCYLRRRDLEAVRAHLRDAAALLDPAHLESHGRYRAALARLAILDASRATARQELLDYLRWATGAGAQEQALDAALLLADDSRDDLDDKVSWLQRGIEHALYRGVSRRLGYAYNELAAALDRLERTEEALEAYRRALATHREHGTSRQVTAALWAVGASAARGEDWPLARATLEEAVERAGESDESSDLLPLALADLAVVHEASGDVVDARRLTLRALGLAREQDLARFWPERWRVMVDYARSLDLDA